MNFSLFTSVRAKSGTLCTRELFLDLSDSCEVKGIHKAIAEAGGDRERVGALKKDLPVITWQAFFPGARKNAEARPSGLFMVDIDHLENPYRTWGTLVGRIKELGILFASKTSSGHGLRVVCSCRPGLTSIAECQQWFARETGLAVDEACKDWARCSYVVPSEYWYYLNASLFDASPVFQPPLQKGEPTPGDHSPEGEGPEVRRHFKGIPYSRICGEWLRATGGEPTEGERNVRLHRLALRLRYITDFDEATMLAVMPRYGLGEAEMRQIVHSAVAATQGSEIPHDLQEVLDRIDRQIKLADGSDEEALAEITTGTDRMPSLPPLLREWHNATPDDFRTAVTLCQLPILGALGSRLRARYLDGRLHSPSFQVSLEAPQASGKSFLVRLVDYELRQMVQADEEARRQEREFQEIMQKIRATNTKIKKDDLPDRPRGIIRYVPATMSITMLLKRMEGAQGLHLFALAEEIDTVTRAFKRGFSNFSEALRVSFDNGVYGQDYASENSWSGNVALYYNCLFSGTPKAMRRFYPDVEDGLVSRVLFVTLPDQFGKPMPVWREFSERERLRCDIALARLNEISLQGGKVQPEHVMKMPWLNEALAEWLKSQQLEAVREQDRTRDIFCRRSAVVGFRAGMLAYFLWGEKSTPAIRKNTADFAVWVANSMLNQHLLRFSVDTPTSNINRWEEVYNSLGDEFTREELERALASKNNTTRPRQVLYKWKLLRIIESEPDGAGSNGKKTFKFKKIKR